MAPRYGENWAPPDGNPACRCAACTDCHQNLGVSAEVPGKKEWKMPSFSALQTVYWGSWIHYHSLTLSKTLTEVKWQSRHSKLIHWDFQGGQSITASHRCKSGNYEIVTKDKVSEWVSALYRILPRPGHKVIIFLTGDSLCSEEPTQAATNALLLLLWHLLLSWQLFRAWAILHSQLLPNCEHVNERVLYKY